MSDRNNLYSNWSFKRIRIEKNFNRIFFSILIKHVFQFTSLIIIVISFFQRFDYSVLKPFLPPKFEYVILVQMSAFQCRLYEYYLDKLAQGGPKKAGGMGGGGQGLFVDFNNLARIWSHPAVLYLAEVRKQVCDFYLFLLIALNYYQQ